MKKIPDTRDSAGARSETGAALVVAILSILLISVLAAALISTGMISRRISFNSGEQTEAFYIAEAGLTHGSALVSQASGSEFTGILQNGLTPIPQDGIAFGRGRYRVRVSDDPADNDGNPNADSNQTLVLTSIGVGRDGSTATLEAVLRVGSSPAILINGDLLLNGNISVSGSAGGIHANGNVHVGGNPCVSQSVSSIGNVTVGGSVQGPGCSGAGNVAAYQPPIEVPTWEIERDFKSRADYILGSDGKVTDRIANDVVHDSSINSNDWYMPGGGGGKWTWNSGSQEWVHGGPSMQADKTYYAVGNMKLPNEFGGPGALVRATFIAEGFIEISGNPYVRKYLDNKYMYMAGTDLKLNGNPQSGSNSSEGIHWARNQIMLNGNPRIDGVVIAANLGDPYSPGCGCNKVPLEGSAPGRMEISGNATVSYNGGLLPGTPRIISWREVRK